MFYTFFACLYKLAFPKRRLILSTMTTSHILTSMKFMSERRGMNNQELKHRNLYLLSQCLSFCIQLLIDKKTLKNLSFVFPVACNVISFLS